MKENLQHPIANESYAYPTTEGILSDDLMKDYDYLNLLAKQYPNIQSSCTEIINLEAIMNLPKGTEHFLSDLHGEYEAFVHLLKNGSGAVQKKIEEALGNTVREKEKNRLAMLIYYPDSMLSKIKEEEDNLLEWYQITLNRLVLILREASSKYTRSKVRKALNPNFSYIIEELLHEQDRDEDKQDYFDRIIRSIIEVGQVDSFIQAMCRVIQRLAVDRLHIIGDIFDRGPGADKIMDRLMQHHSIDIQWGNHDILWMGATIGNLACIANVIRVSAKYGNLATLEEGYGINLIPLATFAMDKYAEDPCDEFDFDDRNKSELSQKEIELIRKMHKAITIIQFKAEGQVIRNNPDFHMEDRLSLNHIDYRQGLLQIGDRQYPLKDKIFPTIDPEKPYDFSKDEQELIEKLLKSFTSNEKLNRHVKFLFTKGSMYLCYNSNLLYHGCIPLDSQGEFASLTIEHKPYSGKRLVNKLEEALRKSFFDKSISSDYFWYLWCGSLSPLYGKTAMKTFERYFVEKNETWDEGKNAYYKLRNDQEVCNRILKEFDLDPEKSHIINGHVPVKVRQGESPILAEGKLLVIDGGLSRAYQKVTGIAGYTLVYNSHGMLLVAHEPFKSKQYAIDHEMDLVSEKTVFEKADKRMQVKNTDVGRQLQQEIGDLKKLLGAFRQGLIKEQI